MKPLPPHPNLDHLKRQAKDLLSGVLAGAPDAIVRLRASVPSAATQSAEQLTQTRLHDAQSCIAREYGFVSWASLRRFVDMTRARAADAEQLALDFGSAAYAGDIVGGMDRSRPEQAARYLALIDERGSLPGWVACACGDLETVEDNLRRDPAWIEKPDGPLGLPPLIAATHSGLVRLPEFRERIHTLVQALIEAGVDPNQSVGSRWPPASPEGPSSDHHLSALYGAAGVNHDPKITRMLLEAGADPNDGESLYHALEAPETVILSLLLDAGVRLEGTNALLHALDFDTFPMFEMLLSYAAPVERATCGRLLHWAIKRRRSVAHIEAILAAGCDPNAVSKDGISALVMALRYGLPKIADVLRKAGAEERLDDEDLFIAACAAGDETAAQQLKDDNPSFPTSFDPKRLRLLSELAASGQSAAVMLMVRLGWPIDIRGGDWDASALNQAVFFGDAELAGFLLAHGARWTEKHGFGDNVCGTLNWASLNRPEPDGDWVACAKALVAHGMPGAVRDPDHPDSVIVDGVQRRFSDEVTMYLLSVGELES
ncbi:MAG: ankyrin repeat domain-containing protein [Pseudomonadota bacterium]